MSDALANAALGYGAGTLCFLVAYACLMVCFVPFVALADPALAREMLREMTPPYMAMSFGWPLFPVLAVVGLFRLVKR